MSEVPCFFLPGAQPDDQEAAYSNLAQRYGLPVPEPTRRIYSITYRHDSEEWTATVGRPLRGVRIRRTRSRGATIERTQHLGDPAIVRAIFPGNPFMVFTDAGKDKRSAWENPFYAGNPRATTYFTAAR